MSINPKFRAETHSFSESYYRNKFEVKGIELFKDLERNPNDLVAKKKIQFINKSFKRGKWKKFAYYLTWMRKTTFVDRLSK